MADSKTAELTWAGSGLSFTATTGLGGTLASDATEGRAGAQPTEVLLAALGACGGMDVVAILEKKRQRVERYEISVSGRQRPEHPRTFESITIEHRPHGPDLDAEAVRRAVELSATRYCPVNAMISAGPTRVSHRYRLPSQGGDAVEVVVTGPGGDGLSPHT
jgi:putative redox protein